MSQGRQPFRSRRGITLIELLISILIVSVIAGAGTRLFIAALDSDKESRSQLQAHRDAQAVVESLRKTAANLTPVPVRGIPPYSESYGENGEGRVYRFVTRVPESLGVWDAGTKEQSASGTADGILMEFAFERDQTTRLKASRRLLGVETGNRAEDMSGILSESLSDFGLTPLYKNDQGGSPSGGAKVPSAFRVRLTYNLPGNRALDVSALLPVHSEAEKTEGK